MSDVVARARAGQLDPVYVLSSGDPLLLRRALDAIRDAAVPEALRAFNCDVFDGKGLSGTQLLAAVQTLPMMATRRLVVVRDLGAMAAGELAVLLDYLEKPNPSSVLVGITAKVDKRLKFYARVAKLRWLHELEPPRQVVGWIQEEAAAQSVRIAGPAARRLADVVGRDLSRLSLALEQLSLYAGGRPVAAADVDELIAETRERTVFELTDAIGAGDPRRALAAVAALCEQRESAVGVVIMVARFVRQLALCQIGRAQRLRGAELARLVGVPPFALDKLGEQAGRYSPDAMARATTLVGQADRALKGMLPGLKTLGRELGERLVLERLVTQLVALRG